MFCAIWCHLHNLKNVENSHKGVSFLVKLHAKACNFTKSNTSPCAFFMLLKLSKWYQIAQNISFGLFETDLNAFWIHLNATWIINNQYASRTPSKYLPNPWFNFTWGSTTTTWIFSGQFQEKLNQKFYATYCEF